MTAVRGVRGCTKSLAAAGRKKLWRDALRLCCSVRARQYGCGCCCCCCCSFFVFVFFVPLGCLTGPQKVYLVDNYRSGLCGGGEGVDQNTKTTKNRRIIPTSAAFQNDHRKTRARNCASQFHVPQAGHRNINFPQFRASVLRCCFGMLRWPRNYRRSALIPGRDNRDMDSRDRTKRQPLFFLRMRRGTCSNYSSAKAKRFVNPSAPQKLHPKLCRDFWIDIDCFQTRSYRIQAILWNLQCFQKTRPRAP